MSKFQSAMADVSRRHADLIRSQMDPDGDTGRAIRDLRDACSAALSTARGTRTVKYLEWLQEQARRAEAKSSDRDALAGADYYEGMAAGFNLAWRKLQEGEE